MCRPASAEPIPDRAPARRVGAADGPTGGLRFWRTSLQAPPSSRGASLTHVNVRWSINIGPPDIAPRVPAHEFGHVLGFVDRYFRGYRDRGPDGYEVLEVITDPTDIMSAPGYGHAQRRHFEALLQSLGAPVPAPPR
jgi:hypothetical protein